MPSYLPDLLVIVAWTGRRIGSVIQLQYSDLLLKGSDTAPHGGIRWRDEADKMEAEWYAPITKEVREVLDRIRLDRPGVGDAWLFPAPHNLSKHVAREVTNSWLRKAEAKAGLAPLEQGLWHPYRRRWSTSRKHLPAKDRAATGGWKDVRTMQRSYEAPDPDTMYEVVSSPRPLRKVGR
jgi:integrase